MDLRQMHYILAIAQDGNMTKAAERLRVSQSTLSMALRQLENKLNVDLFEKRGRGIILTEAGKTFCKEAKDILRRVENLHTLMMSYQLKEHHQITIFSDAIDFSDEAVSIFSSCFSDVHFIQRPRLSNPIPHILRNNQADFVISLTDISDDEFHSTLLLEEPLYAVVPKSSPLAEKDICSLKDLSEYPLVTVLDAFALNTLHYSFFQQIHLPIKDVVETTGVENMVHHVARGQGINFMPESIYKFETTVLKSFNPLAKGIPISDSICRRSIYLTVQRERIHSPIVNAFLDYLVDYGKLVGQLRNVPGPDDFIVTGEYKLKMIDHPRD